VSIGVHLWLILLLRASMRIPSLEFIPARPRVRRKRRKVLTAGPPPPPPPPPPVTLVLVSASYDVGTTSVRLTFDCAIDIAAFNGATLVVDDAADSGNAYAGTGGALLAGANAVDIFLVDPTPPSGPGTTLTVTAGNGIVAVDDGGTWAGVTGLALPFP
jgi:hypothetical protein